MIGVEMESENKNGYNATASRACFAIYIKPKLLEQKSHTHECEQRALCVLS